MPGQAATERPDVEDLTTRPPRIMIVAGEASGDLHGATLAQELRGQVPDLALFGIGGDRMAARHVELLHHVRHLAVVGITEVIRHLGDVRTALTALTDAVEERFVDAVVLIDYPDFNFLLARRLRRSTPDTPIVYYISPQVWAWRRRRIKTIARLIDRMLVILPFEEELYAAAGVPVEFVGHPLLDVVKFGTSRQEFADRHGLPVDGTWIGLLPGSRRAEVERLLPRMLSAAADLRKESLRDRRFLVPMSPSVDRALYESFHRQWRSVRGRVHLIEDDYYATLEHCRVAAVCSGTATLEAALADTPMVVVYKTSWLTYNLARLLVRVRDIALVNLIAGFRAVPELVQEEVKGPLIADELRALLKDDPRRQAVQTALAEVRLRLGRRGASRRAANAVLEVAGLTPQGSPPAGESTDP